MYPAELDHYTDEYTFFAVKEHQLTIPPRLTREFLLAFQMDSRAKRLYE
jgi:hypothetical protein